MLIPVHFSIAGQFKFLNTYDGTDDDGVTANKMILPGTLVTLVANPQTYAGVTINNSYVKRAAAGDYVVGLAGDAFKSDLAASAYGYAADIVVNGAGDTMRSQNRISDMYKETLASGMMTVYSGVGTFRTDQYDTNVATASIMSPLYQSTVSGNGGLLGTSNGTTNQVVGHLVVQPVAFPSGVPGVGGTWATNWIDNSMSLGTLATITISL